MPLRRCLTLCILATWMVAIPPLSAHAAPSTPSLENITNLLVNHSAEDGPGASTYTVIIPPPSWVVSGTLSALQYGADGDVTKDVPGADPVGDNFFFGGPGSERSEAFQIVDLSAFTEDIDAGNRGFRLAGYLGGWRWQGDQATLSVEFQDSGGVSLGATRIGPVTTAERGSQTAFLLRRIDDVVPRFTRRAVVHLVLERKEGYANDGYADRLFFGSYPLTGHLIEGRVYYDDATAGNEVPGAYVEICEIGGECFTTTTDDTGRYVFPNLPEGDYVVRVFPPGGGGDYAPAISGVIQVRANQRVYTQTLIFLKPVPPPQDSGVKPVSFWGDPIELTIYGCERGTATFDLIQFGQVVVTDQMSEISLGIYQVTVAPLRPVHGNVAFAVRIVCPDNSVQDTAFNVYIDPSGVVVDTNGTPIPGVTVTLYRSDKAAGPFDQVVSGTAVMSPSNRQNPMQTDAAGRFGWDVIAGYYLVRSEKSGCLDAADPNQSYAETQVMTIPPPVTDLRLVLNCGEDRLLYLPCLENRR